MDTKRYSLNDIFGILHESTQLLGEKQVTVVSETNDGGHETRTTMSLSDYIAMTVASELTREDSRMASEDFTASKADVEAAMAANYFEEVAFPNYPHPGLIMQGGSRRKTRKSRR
jgi:hypothetical protein